MKVLVTGATGFLGKLLVAQLLAQGDEVHYVTTNASKIKNAKGVWGFVWDPAAGSIDPKALEGVDVIYHLSGATVSKRWTPTYKEEILNSRIQSAATLFQALQKGNHQVKQFISASAVGGYVSSETAQYTEADMKYNPSFLGQVVEAWEKAADQFEQLGIGVTKIRIGLVLSELGGALPVMMKPISLGVGAVFGTGKQYYSWIHVEDLIGLFCFVKNKRLLGAFNGVGDRPETCRDFTVVLAKKMHRPLWLPAVPGWVLKTVLGEMAAVVLESQKVSNDKIKQAGFGFKYQTLEAALEAILSKEKA